jgi:hypothetical protein
MKKKGRAQPRSRTGNLPPVSSKPSSLDDDELVSDDDELVLVSDDELVDSVGSVVLVDIESVPSGVVVDVPVSSTVVPVSLSAGPVSLQIPFGLHVSPSRHDDPG